MRVKVTVAAAAVGALLAVVPAAPAISKPQVFSLLDVSGPETELGPGGGFTENAPPTLGARFAFTDILYKWAGRKRGARVGRVEGLCTFVKVELAERSVTIFCNATFFLPAGQILAAAHIRFAEEGPSTFFVPVIGGAGRYANARGFVKITSIGPEDENSNAEFHLLP